MSRVLCVLRPSGFLPTGRNPLAPSLGVCLASFRGTPRVGLASEARSTGYTAISVHRSLSRRSPAPAGGGGSIPGCPLLSASMCVHLRLNFSFGAPTATSLTIAKPRNPTQRQTLASIRVHSRLSL
jgi:hypothetical protein